MNNAGRELPLALVTVFLITAGYIFLSLNSGTIPVPGGLVGHLGGVAGFILMLMTETLYSLRKRSRRAIRWGSMQSWLQFHIYTGIVGPYLVLLHTSWQFAGLAGLVTLLTILIVLSGFIGRYIYTLVPRSAVGVEIESGDLSTQITTADTELNNWLAANPAVAGALPDEITSLPVLSYNTWLLVFGRIFIEWRYRLRWLNARRHIKGAPRRQIGVLRNLLIRRRQLQYQLASLAFVRRILALWHAVHVPIGIVLFTLAFIHIGAAIYYVTLAR